MLPHTNSITTEELHHTVENQKLTEVKATPIRAHSNSQLRFPCIRLVNGLMLWQWWVLF